MLVRRQQQSGSFFQIVEAAANYGHALTRPPGPATLRQGGGTNANNRNRSIDLMEILLIGTVLIGVAVWLFARTKGGRAPAAKGTAPTPVRAEVEIRAPKVRPDVERAIVSALRDGEEPDAAGWPEHYHGHFLGVAGESFDNPSGTSRQKIIGETKDATVAYLMNEPDNPHDGYAVQVLVPHGGIAAQIGYLPRDHGMAGEVSAGHVAAWFAWKRRSKGGKWGAVLYLLHTSG